MSDGLSNAISIGGAPAASSPGDGGSGQRGGGGDVGGGVESGGSGGSGGSSGGGGDDGGGGSSARGDSLQLSRQLSRQACYGTSNAAPSDKQMWESSTTPDGGSESPWSRAASAKLRRSILAVRVAGRVASVHEEELRAKARQLSPKLDAARRKHRGFASGMQVQATQPLDKNRIEQVEVSLSKVATLLDEQGRRVDAVGTQRDFSTIMGRLGSVEGRLGSMEGRLGSLEDGVARIVQLLELLGPDAAD
mmetsp:Transcript_41396/g.121026  ORF Transcript_41396/g.121026 Transcript_41396/m.121026 type:complete len:249 (+) Transcript_41396:928-1674(+)